MDLELYSPLHRLPDVAKSRLDLLADVACEVREKERLLTKILDQNLPSRKKTEKNPVKNVDTDVSSSKKGMKRKFSSEFEAKNEETKKRRNNMKQTPSTTKVTVSGLKLKFYNISQSCLNSPTVNKTVDVVSKHGILLDFLRNHSFLIPKRKRTPMEEYTPEGIVRCRIKNHKNGRINLPTEDILKGFEKSWIKNHKNERINPPTEDRKNGHQTELPIQEMEGSEPTEDRNERINPPTLDRSNGRQTELPIQEMEGSEPTEDRNETINPLTEDRNNGHQAELPVQEVEGSEPTEDRNDGQQTELPTQFRIKIQELGGSEAKLMIEKKLHTSDVNPNNSRFSIPEKQIQNEFFEEAEELLLDRYEGNGNRLCGLDVLLLDPCLREFNLKLKKWNMKRNIIYNLVHMWNDVRMMNNLEKDDRVQLWSFRRHDQLCLALVKL